MSRFLRIMGTDPHYTMRSAPMWIDSQFIKKVYPVYAEKDENGQYWRSTYDHEGSELIYYLLVDLHGEQFNCSTSEIEKLGIQRRTDKPAIGFLFDRESEEKVPFEAGDV